MISWSGRTLLKLWLLVQNESRGNANSLLTCLLHPRYSDIADDICNHLPLAFNNMAADKNHPSYAKKPRSRFDEFHWCFARCSPESFCRMFDVRYSLAADTRDTVSSYVRN